MHNIPQHLKTEKPHSPFNGVPLNGAPVGRGWDFEYNTTRDEFIFKQDKNTGLLFLEELPTPDEMSKIYPDNYYAFSDEKSQSKIIQIVRDFLERKKVNVYQKLLKNRDTINVLDIGAGDGRLLSIIRKHTSSNWSFYGVEIGEKGVIECQNKGFNVVQGDVEFCELKDWSGKFDLILMHQLLEHTRSPSIMVQKCAEWLRPGGIVSIETPDTLGWDFLLFKKRYWGGYHFPRHFFIFNKNSLHLIGDQAGLSILRAQSILSPVFWIHSIHNFCADHPKLTFLTSWLKPTNILLLAFATALEALQLFLRGKSCNLQVLMTKKDR